MNLTHSDWFRLVELYQWAMRQNMDIVAYCYRPISKKFGRTWILDSEYNKMFLVMEEDEIVATAEIRPHWEFVP